MSYIRTVSGDTSSPTTAQPLKGGLRWRPFGEMQVNQMMINEGFAIPYFGGRKTQ